MRDPAELLHRIKMCVCLSRLLRSFRQYLIDVLFRRLTGVLEVGLFTGMAEAAYFGYPDGTVLARTQDGALSLLPFSFCPSTPF